VRSETLDAVRADALAAIDRIQRGVPNDPKLLERALRGNLELNPTTISIESGRSRTYFGYKGCPLPDVWLRILELRTTSARVVAYRELIARLQEQIAGLEHVIWVKDSAMATLIVAATRAGSRQEVSADVLAYRSKRQKSEKTRQLRAPS
jgi:hypothetical protein